MERTLRREEFFREARTNPYLAMVARMHAQAWASGYEQALRDVRELVDKRGALDMVNIDTFQHEKSFSDRARDADEWLTADQQRAEANMVVALAKLGELVPSELLTPRG